MECDKLFVNFDWDPAYLSEIFAEDFDDYSEMWNEESVGDDELVKCVEKMDLKQRYCPIVEDISMDDSMLCAAVEQIENE